MNTQFRAVDNRDSENMLVYYEARIEALQSRIRELEKRLQEQSGEEVRIVNFMNEAWRLHK